MNVLLVEDDPSVRGAVERALRGAGHKVELATAGDRALAAATAIPYDAIVLDRGLPGLDGLEVCRRLRAVGNSVPILMLTARSAVSERVEGLDAGADDYVVKPFALDELLARLRAFERRSPVTGQPRGELRFADLELDRDAMTARRGGREIPLTRTEYQLLELLLANAKRVLTRVALLTAGAVATAAIGAAILMYFVVQTQLRTQFDNTLTEAAKTVRDPRIIGPAGRFPGGPRGSLSGRSDVAAQTITITTSTGGTVTGADREPVVALVTTEAAEVAAGVRG